jgi:hypothetical protein
MNNIKTLWDKFNDWIDPKAGIHIFWLVPLLYGLHVIVETSEMLNNAFKCVKKPFQKRYIKELKKLAGIK